MAQVRGALHHWRYLFDGASAVGAVTFDREKRNDVVNKQAEGQKAAEQGTAGLENGMDRHGNALLSVEVFCVFLCTFIIVSIR